jgi:hypothetical protein
MPHSRSVPCRCPPGWSSPQQPKSRQTWALNNKHVWVPLPTLLFSFLFILCWRPLSWQFVDRTLRGGVLQILGLCTGPPPGLNAQTLYRVRDTENPLKIVAEAHPPIEGKCVTCNNKGEEEEGGINDEQPKMP